MSGLRSSRNLLAPPTLIRAGFLEVFLSGLHPGAKSFQMRPQTSSYIALAPYFAVTNAEFNKDGYELQDNFVRRTGIDL